MAILHGSRPWRGQDGLGVISPADTKKVGEFLSNRNNNTADMKQNKENSTAKQFVSDYLVLNGYENIAKDLDNVSAQYQRALADMIKDYIKEGKTAGLVHKVIHDVAGLCIKDKIFKPRCHRFTFTTKPKRKGVVA